MARAKNQSPKETYAAIVAALAAPLWPEVAVALTPPLDLTPDAYAEQRVVLPRALGERATISGASSVISGGFSSLA